MYASASQGPAGGIFTREDKEPRDSKEEGVESVDGRVDDVQVREGDGSEGITFMETWSDDYEDDS